MGIKKKHIIIGSIALVSVTAAYLYWQFQKFMQYAIKFSAIRIKSITPEKLDFDLTLLFTNPSNIKINIVGQEYKAFINNTLITTASNQNPQIIQSKAVSSLNFNVIINWKNITGILQNIYKDVLTNPASIILKVNINVKVKLLFFNVNVPYVYTTNLKELMSKKDTPKKA